MPPQLALLLGFILVYAAFRSDRSRNYPHTQDLFFPTLWYLVVTTHPIGYWCQLWGIPIPNDSADATEGSPIDRYFFLTLTIFGLRILAKRHFSWGPALRANRPLITLLAFMALSIFWSQYPFVSLKRFVKVFGSLVMALVILSQPNPLDAFTTVLRRTLYVHLPMSLICTRYFRDIGVSFDWSGATEAWCGIATTKNVLGQVAMLGALYFSAQVRQHWHLFHWRNLHVLYLLIALFLLKGAGSISLTSVAVCAFSLLIFFRIHSLRSTPAAIPAFVKKVFFTTTALITLVLVHSVTLFSADSIFGHLITLFGRDITLTDRTFIWSDVYAAAGGFTLTGVGYGGFWIGRISNIPWNATMTWVLGQAHSGYIDTYLQIGWIGALLLASLIFSSIPVLLNDLSKDFDFAALRITLFLTILFINITESTFLRGDHHLWLILLLVLWKMPAPSLPKSSFSPT
ncbi:MAG: O-antigen ligase family protein [Verrucomicrobia bacterium]|nr:O-antigen ligase family protein [Verrucomicrobiota bacterium]